MELKNKTAVISGAASGLGKATAMALAAEGANVVLLDLNRQAGEQAAGEIGEGKAIFVAANICDATEISDALEIAQKKFGALHICINCAGIAPAEKLLNRDGVAMPLENFQRVLDINLLGTFNLSRLAAEYMIKSAVPTDSEERGVIIHTASVAAYEGQIGQCAYAASKAGVIGLTLPMAREMASWGIRVNAIAPGIMGTPMMKSMPENVQASLAEKIPFPKRMGYPEEFAGLVKHIIENTYMNGEVVRLDGAIRMSAR